MLYDETTKTNGNPHSDEWKFAALAEVFHFSNVCFRIFKQKHYSNKLLQLYKFSTKHNGRAPLKSCYFYPTTSN